MVDEHEKTKWSILGSGEGGTRIASFYFASVRRPAVGQRIFLINSNRDDLETVIESIRPRIDPSFGDRRLEEIRRQHVAHIGEERGTGNMFFVGEDHTRAHFDSRIRRKMNAMEIPQAEAMMSLLALGGGTGNGSIPYIVRLFKEGDKLADAKMKMFCIAAWPFKDEAAHRHVNALAGVSRLLVDETSGESNSDMVIVCDNSRLRSIPSPNRLPSDPEYYHINRHIVKAIDFLSSSSRDAVSLIDIEDLVAQPTKQGFRHFTFGLSIDNPFELVSLEAALDMALEDAAFEFNPRTCLGAYLFVRVPEDIVGREEFSVEGVQETFATWCAQSLGRLAISYPSFGTKPEGDGFDVMILFGGFDLGPALARASREFETYKRSLALDSTNSSMVSRLEKVERNLTGYMERVEAARELWKEQEFS